MMSQNKIVPRPIRRLASFLLLICAISVAIISLDYISYPATVSDKIDRQDVIMYYSKNTPANTSVIEEAWTFQNKPRVFFYSRAPKCGSRTVLAVFRKLKSLRTVHSNVVAHHYLSHKEQEAVVSILSKKSRSPMVYDRHVPMINFTRFGQPFPIYINVIRDPLGQFESQFNFRRHGSGVTRKKLKAGKMSIAEKKELAMTMDDCVKMNSHECGEMDPATNTLWIRKSIPFFLGQDIHIRNSTSAMLPLAKRNVQKFYAVVGILEDLQTFFETLEYLFPESFQAATAHYKKIWRGMKESTKTRGKKNASDDTREILKYRLRFEYDFYNFIKQRLYILYTHLKNNGGRL